MMYTVKASAAITDESDGVSGSVLHLVQYLYKLQNSIRAETQVLEFTDKYVILYCWF